MFVMWIDHISIPYCCVLRRVAGWVAGWVGNGVAGGCWDDEITSDEMDHSLKFPTFSTSKFVGVQRFTNLAMTGAPQNSSPGIAAALTMWASPG